MDAVEQAGIADNTLIVFSSDNAAGDVPAFGVGGSNGPFRSDFFTPPTEGSLRVSAMVRWPGKVPAGVVTEQPLTCHDWYKTFAALAGASDEVPADRPLDSVDASEFLLGKSKTSGRQAVLFFGGDGELMSVKWRNVKVWLRYSERLGKPYVKPQFPMIFGLESDLGERYDLFYNKMDMGRMFGVAMRFITDWEKSVAQYPNIKPGQEFDGHRAKVTVG